MFITFLYYLTCNKKIIKEYIAEFYYIFTRYKTYLEKNIFTPVNIFISIVKFENDEIFYGF